MTLEMGKPLKSAVDFPELKRVVELHQAAGEPARSDQSVRSCNACRTVQPDALVLDLLRERISQASEPAHAHPHREVLALHVRCAYVKIGRNGETLDPCAGRTPNRHGHYEPHIPEVFPYVTFSEKLGGARQRRRPQVAASITPRREFSRLWSARPGSCPACNPGAIHTSDTGKS
jgi:hypothetical protein